MKEYEVFLCADSDLKINDDQIAYLEKALDEVWVKTAIENNGIGPYEFWGQRCNDRGTDYAEAVDWDTIVVHVLVHGVDENDSIEKGVDDILNEFTGPRTERIHGSDAFTEIKPKFERVSEIHKNGNAALVFDIVWECNGEIND